MQTLSDPGSYSQTLFEDARELSAAFVRNEYRTGLLPPDAASVMVLGFERAGEAGLAESYMELASLYRSGGTWRSPLLPRDDNRAIELFRVAERLAQPDVTFELAKTVYYAKRTDLAQEAWKRADLLLELREMYVGAALICSEGVTMAALAGQLLFLRDGRGGDRRRDLGGVGDAKAAPAR